jgi:hypothetical protein
LKGIVFATSPSDGTQDVRRAIAKPFPARTAARKTPAACGRRKPKPQVCGEEVAEPQLSGLSEANLASLERRATYVSSAIVPPEGNPSPPPQTPPFRAVRDLQPHNNPEQLVCHQPRLCRLSRVQVGPLDRTITTHDFPESQTSTSLPFFSSRETRTFKGDLRRTGTRYIQWLRHECRDQSLRRRSGECSRYVEKQNRATNQPTRCKAA